MEYNSDLVGISQVSPKHEFVISLDVVIRLFTHEVRACASVVKDCGQGRVHAAELLFERLQPQIVVFLVEEQTFIKTAKPEKNFTPDHETGAGGCQTGPRLHGLVVILS